MGCAKMTYGDVCDVPSDYADTSAQIFGHSEKVYGAEADRLQLVLKKSVLTSTSGLHVRQR